MRKWRSRSNTHKIKGKAYRKKKMYLLCKIKILFVNNSVNQREGERKVVIFPFINLGVNYKTSMRNASLYFRNAKSLLFTVQNQFYLLESK